MFLVLATGLLLAGGASGYRYRYQPDHRIHGYTYMSWWRPKSPDLGCVDLDNCRPLQRVPDMEKMLARIHYPFIDNAVRIERFSIWENLRMRDREFFQPELGSAWPSDRLIPGVRCDGALPRAGNGPLPWGDSPPSSERYVNTGTTLGAICDVLCSRRVPSIGCEDRNYTKRDAGCDCSNLNNMKTRRPFYPGRKNGRELVIGEWAETAPDGAPGWLLRADAPVRVLGSDLLGMTVELYLPHSSLCEPVRWVLEMDPAVNRKGQYTGVAVLVGTDPSTCPGALVRPDHHDDAVPEGTLPSYAETFAAYDDRLWSDEWIRSEKKKRAVGSWGLREDELRGIDSAAAVIGPIIVLFIAWEAYTSFIDRYRWVRYKRRKAEERNQRECPGEEASSTSPDSPPSPASFV